MPRWYVDIDTKKKLEVFNTKLSAALNRPAMEQEQLMRLLMKHEDAILNVITAAEAVDNNSGPLQQGATA